MVNRHSDADQNGRVVQLLSNMNWMNFVAGTVAGATSTAIFHPLELIKVRWQVYEEASLNLKNIIKSQSTPSGIKIENAPKYRPKYKGLADTFLSVYNSENGIRGLYRGITINTLASGSAWGIYFLIYNGLKSRHQKINSSNNNSKKGDLSLANYTLDATIAGVTTIFITNPLFLIKTRMCLQYSQANPENSSKIVKYKNSFEAFKSLIKSDGFFGLYKGILPGLFGTLNGTIQMVTYDLMKSWWLKHLKRKHNSVGSDIDPKLDTFHYSIFSSMSKILAVVCTYPFQLVRARVQDQHQNYKNIFDVIKKTYRNEKFYGFYKGLIPCLIRVTPAAAVTFIVYENLLLLMK